METEVNNLQDPYINYTRPQIVIEFGGALTLGL